MRPRNWDVGLDLPEHEAHRLRRAVTGRSHTDLVLCPELTDEEQRRFETLAARRLGGEPLQYLEGTVEFGPVTLRIDRRALIPRPETEELLELAGGLVTDPAVIIDLCTGSGNLALALAATFPRAAVYATDLSPEAADLARENASALGLDIAVFEGDLFDPLPEDLRGAADLIVANPPYIAEGDPLPEVVADHEPSVALYGGPDGLDVVRRIAATAAAWLAPRGVIVCEIGATQGRLAADLFARLGGSIRRDLADRDRFVVGRAAR